MAHSKGHVTRVPHDIVDAIRHHFAIGERGIVVVVNLYWLGSVCCAVVPSVRTKQFLFLSVNAEYGNAVLLTVFSQPFYILELFVAQLAICHGQSLYGLALDVPFSFYNLPDGIEAYLYMVLLGEYRLNLRGCQPEPLRVGILRKPGYVERYNFAEDGDILGMLGECTLPASSLLTDSAHFKMLSRQMLMTASIDGVTGYIKDTADKADTMPAKPICYDSDELPRLSLVCVSKVLHFLVCYYICWIIRDLHNCLKLSYKCTNF